MVERNGEERVESVTGATQQLSLSSSWKPRPQRQLVQGGLAVVPSKNRIWGVWGEKENFRILFLCGGIECLMLVGVFQSFFFWRLTSAVLSLTVFFCSFLNASSFLSRY